MTQTPKSYRSGDKRMHPQLAAEVAGVRGCMEAAAERFPLPARFEAFAHNDRAAMVVHDKETGRSTVVSLYAYGAVRQALNELFGEG